MSQSTNFTCDLDDSIAGESSGKKKTQNCHFEEFLFTTDIKNNGSHFRRFNFFLISVYLIEKCGKIQENYHFTTNLW